MSFDLRVGIIIPALCVLGGCTGRDDDSLQPELMVDMSNVKGQCAVRGFAMKCDDVPRYLRDTLKVPKDTYIAVRSPAESATFDAMNPVMKALNDAGYEKVIGSIELDGEAPKR
jgi:hypothetical protein